jgi:hypothetical protein
LVTQNSASQVAKIIAWVTGAQQNSS